MTDQRKILGKEAELAAAEMLRSSGYRILERNYRMRFAEIDIVAMDGKTVCFIEVKARSGDSRGTAQEAVGYAKQRKLTLAAQAFLKHRGLGASKARFDVVAVQKDGNGLKASLIRNAFEAVA